MTDWRTRMADFERLHPEDESSQTVSSAPSALTWRPRMINSAWIYVGLVAIAIAGTAIAHMPSGKTLRCEITTTMSTDIHDARQPVIYEKPTTMTLTLRIVSDTQWQTLSIDGMDVASIAHQTQIPMPEHPVFQPLRTTDQFYIFQDSANVPNPYNAKLLESDFMSIDRATGEVTGKMHLHSEDSNIDNDDVKTGHCTPVTGSIL
jgi:hypothetical protein